MDQKPDLLAYNRDGVALSHLFSQERPDRLWSSTGEDWRQHQFEQRPKSGLAVRTH